MKAALLLAALGALAACQAHGEVIGDVQYDTRYGDVTTMDVHVPDAAARPAIMLIHGGAWRFGDKDAYTAAAERYAAAGYVAATIGYRLVPAGVYPAAMQDCLCALSFLRANAPAYGIDPDRIAVSGYSAGGQLSALVGVGADNPAHQPDCAWGPAGAGRGDCRRRYLRLHRRRPGRRRSDFLGGSPDEVPDHYVSSVADPPGEPVGAAVPLVIHGDGNLIIDPADAQRLVDALPDAALLELAGAGTCCRRPPRPARMPIHGHCRRLPVNRASSGGDRLEAAEEEPAAGHQLHGDDPGSGLECTGPRQQNGDIGAHVAHRRDALGQQLAEVERQVFRRPAVHHEEQVDMRVDQSGYEILPMRVDDAGIGGHRAFAGRTGADHPVAADHGYRVGDLASAGPIPQGGADDGHGGHQRHRISPGELRASAGGGGQSQTAQKRG